MSNLSTPLRLSRLERLLSGREDFTHAEISFIEDILEDEDIVSQVDGLFLKYREVGEGILRIILDCDPSYLNASFLLILLLESSGRHQEAEEQHKKSIELYPDEAFLAAKYGQFLHNYGRDEEAETLFQRALRLDALDPILRVHYANFLEECGKWGKAKKLYKQAKKLTSSEERLRELIDRKLRDPDSVVWGLYYRMPTESSVSRFAINNSEELLRVLDNYWRPVLIDPSQVDLGEFLSRARTTGQYYETILWVEAEKRRRSVPDPEEWAYLEELDLLNDWKPGFGLMLSQRFFDSKCASCGLVGRKKLGCAEGYYYCVFEEEYLQFERENIHEIVEKLKDGADPESIPQLQVPKHLSELITKLSQPGPDSA